MGEASPSASIRNIRAFALVSLGVSLFFWVWAILNTVRDEFDLGVVSFLTVALSSSYLLWRCRGTDRPPPGRVAQIVVVLTHWFVSANYVLGALFGFRMANPPRVGFGVYCAVFSVLWLVSGLLAYRFIGAVRRSAVERTSSEESHLRGAESIP